MPYPYEHAARLLSPNFDRYRRHNDKFGKGIAAIWGIRSNKAYLQAIRFSAERFTSGEARKWLSEHGYKPVLFEAATHGNPSGEELYWEFHGKNPKHLNRLHVHYPKRLVYLGKAYSVEYLSNKHHGGGDGTMAIYRHKFDTPAIVCIDETAKRQIYIIGNRVKVTDAGIEG